RVGRGEAFSEASSAGGSEGLRDGGGAGAGGAATAEGHTMCRRCPCRLCENGRVNARDRHRRALRGSAAATAATFVALASHIIGGGSIPTLWGLIAPSALSTLVCVLLAGRKLSLWRLSASVVASQALFHQLFTVFTPLASAPGPTNAVERHAHHHAGAMSSMGGMGIGSGDPTDPAMSSGAHAHGSLPMLL